MNRLFLVIILLNSLVSYAQMPHYEKIYWKDEDTREELKFSFDWGQHKFVRYHYIGEKRKISHGEFTYSASNQLLTLFYDSGVKVSYSVEKYCCRFVWLYSKKKGTRKFKRASWDSKNCSLIDTDCL